MIDTHTQTTHLGAMRTLRRNGVRNRPYPLLDFVDMAQLALGIDDSVNGTKPWTRPFGQKRSSKRPLGRRMDELTAPKVRLGGREPERSQMLPQRPASDTALDLLDRPGEIIRFQR